LGWGTGQPWAIAYAGITVLVLIARRLPKQQQGN
jgi:AGZA family xanthine/uracil permease-like MFS transporter